MRAESEERERSNQVSTFMSKGSKKILQSSALPKSRSMSQFLERNYYNPHERSKLKGELSITNANRKRATRDHSAGGLARDLSGSKISFLNSTASVYLGREDGQRLFSPTINVRSRLMSPRDQGTTYFMLHQQALNQQHKKQLMAYNADQQAKLKASQATADNVNLKSDAYLVKQFYQEFCKVIQT
jgi:hypothetical protein